MSKNVCPLTSLYNFQQKCSSSTVPLSVPLRFGPTPNSLFVDPEHQKPHFVGLFREHSAFGSDSTPDLKSNVDEAACYGRPRRRKFLPISFIMHLAFATVKNSVIKTEYTKKRVYKLYKVYDKNKQHVGVSIMVSQNRNFIPILLAQSKAAVED